MPSTFHQSTRCASRPVAKAMEVAAQSGPASPDDTDAISMPEDVYKLRRLSCRSGEGSRALL